jgi:hypothetical protein
MSLVTKFFGRKEKTPNTSLPPLSQYFLSLEKGPDNPYALALEMYANVKKSAESADEFLLYLLEDAVFASIYATFFEEILDAIHRNPEMAWGMINRFENDSDERERIVAELTEYHVAFITRGGKCTVCPACANHGDVAELVAPWQNRDIAFFSSLYTGMQTIKMAMENLLYDGLTAHPGLTGYIGRGDILSMRQFIFEWSAKKA